MPNRLPAPGYDLSDRQLGRTQLNNPLRDFLKYYATRDRVVVEDDFLGDAINLDLYAVAAGGTGVSFNLTTVTVNGYAIATSGTTSGQICSIVSPAIWAGNNNCEVEARFQFNTVSSLVAEFGFVDSGGTGTTLACTDVDVVTFNVTNAALWTIDTSQTHTGMAFVSIGSYTSQTMASTLLTSGTTSPSANTDMTVKVALRTGVTGKTKAYCWINGKLRASHDTVTPGYINGESGLCAWFAFGTRTSAARIAKIDYLRIVQDRAALGAALE